MAQLNLKIQSQCHRLQVRSDEHRCCLFVHCLFTCLLCLLEVYAHQTLQTKNDRLGCKLMRVVVVCLFVCLLFMMT